MTTYKKKLIEVALPLEAINIASAKEKQPGIGAHPRGLHLWWARRPQATARAIVFSQMVDDPSSHPELFPTEESQEKERQRLFRIIEKLVLWENTSNEKVLEQARAEIRKSWERTCEENKNYPNANELFNPNKLPAFHDPFAGGGAIPLEAQRLGLESYASDLNPVAVLINKAMIEIPPKFAGKEPVNSEYQTQSEFNKQLHRWRGSKGLAADILYYGQWVRNEAKKKIGHLFPKIKITKEMTHDRPDLKPYENKDLTIIAWIWTRTVKSPNPAFSDVAVPLSSTFFLSTKSGKETYIEPQIKDNKYVFVIKTGKPKDYELVKMGTTAGKRNAFRCLMSGSPITYDYIRSEGQSKNIGVKLMAIVAQGTRGRVYLAPSEEQEYIAQQNSPRWVPDLPLPNNPRDFKTPLYGFTNYGELFTYRQLIALITLSDLIHEVKEQVYVDAVSANMDSDKKGLDAGGCGALAYAEAVMVYLSFAIDRLSDYNSSITTWKPSGEQVMQTFKRQAIPMTWDFPESNIFASSAICWDNAVKYSAENLIATGSDYKTSGLACQANAQTQKVSISKVVSTDPPYYDNIGYADLSDFFYVWLRNSLKTIYPQLFSTMAVPKVDELVATPYRHGSKTKAEAFFLDGMTKAMRQLSELSHPAFPVTIYYAFKQSENDGNDGTSSTGWETFLEAVIRAGFSINGTWPVRTELSNRMIGMGANALASSIVLVCQKRSIKVNSISRRDFFNQLKSEIPLALKKLQMGGIAPVDLAQSAIGPGIGVFSRYTKVLENDGTTMTVKTALTIINQVLDETLAEQEGEFDSDTRWAIAWFEQFGFNEGTFGDADGLARAKNTSVEGLVHAGFLHSKSGKVRLLKREELLSDWTPETDTRLTIWETTQYLIRTLESKGEQPAAVLLRRLGAKAEISRDLAYRLYTLCERKGWTHEAGAYNGLVIVWSELSRLAAEYQPLEQGRLF